MMLFLLSCLSQDIDSPSADELVETYQTAYCNVYSQSTCGSALAECGEPALIFSDWDACIDVEINRFSQCENIESLFLTSAGTVDACVDLLNAAGESCSAEDLCPDGPTITAEGSCAEVIALINNCEPA